MAAPRKPLGVVAALFLLVSGVAHGQNEITSRLSRETIFSGETVTLMIEATGSPRGLEPDYSVLAGDFLLGDTTTSSQLSVINDQRKLRTQWAIELEPKTEGTITIPPVPVGSALTRPLTLQVLPRGQARDGVAEIFLEMDISADNPYVHSQVLLTIRLYHVNALTEGRLIEPALPDAVVERLGEDVADSALIDGTRYRVLVRRFALFPEKSGPMSIPPARFRGRVADNQSGFNSIFDRGRRVSVASEPIELEVRPRPATFGGANWLPAAALEVDESWPRDEVEFVVGEPATRRLTLKAKGLLAVQLPEIELPELDGVKIYPDKAQSQSRTDGTWVYGEREQTYAFVPTRAGTLSLPEIRIPWWDTVNDAYREAVVPAREVLVRPGALPATPPAPGPQPNSATGTATADRGDLWRWLSLAMLVIWLLTLVAWRIDRRSDGGKPDADGAPENLTARQWRSRLRGACEAGDARRAEEALRGWATAHAGYPVRSLGAVLALVADPAARDAIRELDQLLYRGGAQDWDGSALAKVGAEFFAEASRSDAASPGRHLAPLYPEG